MAIIKLKENFNLKSLSLLGVALMIIGVFTEYMTGLTPLHNLVGENKQSSLMQVIPFFAIIIIIVSILILIGYFKKKDKLSLISGIVGFVSNILFVIMIKTPEFYGEITGANGLADSFDVEDSELYDYSLTETLNDDVKCSIGFYLILLGTFLVILVYVIDKIRRENGISTNIIDKASNISAKTSNFVTNIKFDSGNWICESCDKENNSKSDFCVFCGKAKPLPRRCYKCGTRMEQSMQFCPKCGTAFDREKLEEMAERQKISKAEISYAQEKTVEVNVNDSRADEVLEKQKSKKKEKGEINFKLLILIISVIIVLVAGGITAYILINKSNEAKIEKEIEKSKQEIREDLKDKDTIEDTDDIRDLEGATITNNAGEFTIGKMYLVKDNIRVRETPGEDGRWIDREELDSFDYDSSVEGDKAVIKNGSLVKCLEMQGDWMRIDSGWICCYSEGEILVE